MKTRTQHYCQKNKHLWNQTGNTVVEHLHIIVNPVFITYQNKEGTTNDKIK